MSHDAKCPSPSDRRAGGPERGCSNGPALAAHSYRREGWLVVDAEGDLDIATVPLLQRYVERDALRVVFDLSHVTFLDASLLNLLAVTAQDRRRRHGAVRVVGASALTRRLLALTDLDRAVGLCESVAPSRAEDSLPAGEPGTRDRRRSAQTDGEVHAIPRPR